MPRPSTIDRLPAEVREGIKRLRDQGRTIDEILAKLRELDDDAIVSRSALGRHIKGLDAAAALIREKRITAEAINRDIDGASDSQLARANNEIMHALLMEVATAAKDEDGVTLTPQNVMMLAKALDHLGKASKDDVNRLIAVEKRTAEREREKAMKAASRAVEASAGQPIDGSAILQKIREEIYGMGAKPA